MKFPMYEETKDKKYRDDPYRAVNFRVNEAGRLVCPNGKEFLFLRTEPVKGNQYGRTVELHQCEDCSGCPHRSKCHKSRFDRIIRLNYELTSIHKEVLEQSEQYSWCVAPNKPLHTIRRDLWRNKGKPRIRTVPKKGHKQGNFGDCPDKLRF